MNLLGVHHPREGEDDGKFISNFHISNACVTVTPLSTQKGGNEMPSKKFAHAGIAVSFPRLNY
jgi:hypothetical protein